MHNLILPLLLAALTATAASAEPVTFDFAQVGNAGNVADPETGYGAVAYNYAISKTEVTNAQYAEFLNAVAATDGFGGADPMLYNVSMGNNPSGGITRSGAPGSYTYATKSNSAAKPVTYVSYFDAMRFTNWLHNGQGSGGTETGAYIIGNGVNEVRSANAKFWIPSEDEWYKAAYHDASAGTAAVYFDYATGSDIMPVSDQPGDDPAAANYFNNDGLANGFNDGYAVSGSKSFPSSTDPSTEVGTYMAAASPYGTFDQNGNVWEWNEAVINSFYRGLRGGSWLTDSNAMRADNQGSIDPRNVFGSVGFRVATVPEPSTMLLGALAATGLLMRKRG